METIMRDAWGGVGFCGRPTGASMNDFDMLRAKIIIEGARPCPTISFTIHSDTLFNPTYINFKDVLENSTFLNYLGTNSGIHFYNNHKNWTLICSSSTNDVYVTQGSTSYRLAYNGNNVSKNDIIQNVVYEVVEIGYTFYLSSDTIFNPNPVEFTNAAQNSQFVNYCATPVAFTNNGINYVLAVDTANEITYIRLATGSVRCIVCNEYNYPIHPYTYIQDGKTYYVTGSTEEIHYTVTDTDEWTFDDQVLGGINPGQTFDDALKYGDITFTNSSGDTFKIYRESEYVHDASILISRTNSSGTETKNLEDSTNTAVNRETVITDGAVYHPHIYVPPTPTDSFGVYSETFPDGTWNLTYNYTVPFEILEGATLTWEEFCSTTATVYDNCTMTYYDLLTDATTHRVYIHTRNSSWTYPDRVLNGVFPDDIIVPNNVYTTHQQFDTQFCLKASGTYVSHMATDEYFTVTPGTTWATFLANPVEFTNGDLPYKLYIDSNNRVVLNALYSGDHQILGMDSVPVSPDDEIYVSYFYHTSDEEYGDWTLQLVSDTLFDPSPTEIIKSGTGYQTWQDEFVGGGIFVNNGKTWTISIVDSTVAITDTETGTVYHVYEGDTIEPAHYPIVSYPTTVYTVK